MAITVLSFFVLPESASLIFIFLFLSSPVIHFLFFLFFSFFFFFFLFFHLHDSFAAAPGHFWGGWTGSFFPHWFSLFSLFYDYHFSFAHFFIEIREMGMKRQRRNSLFYCFVGRKQIPVFSSSRACRKLS